MRQVTEKVKEEKRWDGEDTVAIKYRATGGRRGAKIDKNEDYQVFFY